MSLTYSATARFTAIRDVGQLGYSWSPLYYAEYERHYPDITTYLIRENADTAFVCLLFGPAVSITFGLLGDPPALFCAGRGPQPALPSSRSRGSASRY